MTTPIVDAELERLCDAVVASIRGQLIKSGVPFLTIVQSLAGLRDDPRLKDSIRTALRTGDPKFPHCDAVRARLGWDQWQ
jgi:hypothetical protein